MNFNDFFKRKTVAQNQPTQPHDAEMVASARAPVGNTPVNLGQTQAYVPFGTNQEVPRKTLDQVKARLKPNDKLNYYKNGNYFVTVDQPDEQKPQTNQPNQGLLGGFKNWFNRSGSVA